MNTKASQVAVVLLTVVVVAAVAAFVIYDQRRVHTLKMGGRDAFTQVLDEVLARQSPRIRLQVAEKTAGSVENLQLLQERKADLVVVQNDVQPVPPEARLVAFLFPQLFQLVVPEGSAIQSVGDLRGKRVGTGRVGGGTYHSFVMLINYYGLTSEDMTIVPQSGSTVTELFLRADLDAIFRAAEIPDPTAGEVLKTGDARIVPIDQAQTMQLTMPYLQAFTLPRGLYKAHPPVPAQDVATVGAQTALLAHKDIDAEIIREITRVLFEHRLDLVSRIPLASSISSPVGAPSLSAAVHDGAQAYYDREKPGFLVMYSEVIALLITIGTMAGSAVLALRVRLHQGQKNRVEQYDVQLINLVEQVENTNDPARLDAVRQELRKMFRQVVEDVDNGRLSADSLQSFFASWELATSTMRHRELILSTARDSIRQT